MVRLFLPVSSQKNIPGKRVIPVKLESETMAEGHLKSTKKFQLLLKAIVLRAVIVS